VANDRQTLHTFLTARQKGAIVLSPAASPNADRLSKTISPTASAVNVQFTPQHKRVATRLCEISVFKNCHAQELSEANCHERLDRSKHMLKT